MIDMKKIALLSLAALALLACQREVDFQQKEAEPTYTVTLQAGIQAPTKTTYTDEGKFSWEAGDKIGVLVTNGTVTRQITFTTQDAKPIATFTGEVPEGFELADMASYPFTGIPDGEKCTSDLVYNSANNAWMLWDNTNPNPANPLSSIPLLGTKDVNGYYQFKTAAGIVKFTVQNVPSATKLVELKGVEGAKLTGIFGLNDKGVLGMDKAVEATSAVRNYNSPAGKKNTTMDFYFFLPEGSLAAGTELRLLPAENADEAIKSFPFKTAVEVVANKVVSVKAIEMPEEADRKVDSLALVAIYNASDGANWKESRRWNLEASIDTWPGIKLNEEGRVIEMSITNGTVSTVEWEIPEALAKLDSLSTLQIVGSKLKGQIPDFLYDMTSLAKIRLNSNNLTGTLSEKFGQWKNLTELYLNGNKELGGDLPETIGQLTKLESINIAQTAIGGPIPQSLVNCASLKNFMAYSAGFTGEIPDFWDKLPAIGVLQLYDNAGLTGPIPASIGKLQNATGIQLKNCNLTGNIPATFGDLPKCGNLQLNGNKLFGVVPAEVQAHAKWLVDSGWKYEINILPQQDGYGLTLEVSRQSDSLALVAIYNASKGAEWTKNKWDLTQPIDTWSAVTVTDDRVTALKLNVANVIASEWELPNEVALLTEITDLRINSNKLTGSIPEAVYSLPKLQKLYFQNNNLTGSLSSALGNLSELAELYIDRNTNFGGKLPASIGKLKKLTSINIAKTSIGGAIPQELSQCASLKNFMAYENKLSGQIPDFWDKLPTIGVLQLYDNPGLTGPIPATIGTLKAATGIQLKNCNLTGNIPASFAGLEKCGNLQLNGNKLYGVVPAEVQAHPKWLPDSGWKYEVNILPQQEGYGLVLTGSGFDGRWQALRFNDDPESVAFVAIFAGSNLNLYIIPWGQRYLGTYQFAEGVITYNISKAYQAYTDVSYDGEGNMTGWSWMAGGLDADTLALSAGYDWYVMDAETLATYKEDLKEFSFQLQDGNTSAKSSLFGIEDLVFTKVK